MQPKLKKNVKQPKNLYDVVYKMMRLFVDQGTCLQPCLCVIFPFSYRGSIQNKQLKNISDNNSNC